MKKKIGYKIVCNYGNGIYYSMSGSLFNGSIDSTDTCIYEIGKTTKPHPNCGPLCLFETLKDVEFVFKSSPELKKKICLLKVEYAPSRGKKIWFRTIFDTICDATLENIRRLYSNTVLATSITPLEVVKL